MPRHRAAGARSNKRKKERQKRRRAQVVDEAARQRELAVFTERMLKLGLTIKAVKSDGNCVYRAVSDQLTGDENNHAMYRNLACEYILAHRTMFEPFVEDETFEEFLEDIQKDGIWAGNIELQALALVLGVNIAVHRAVGSCTTIEGSSDGRWVHLAYQLGNHYNSIRWARDSGPATEIALQTFEGEVQVQEDSLPRELEENLTLSDEPQKLRNPRPDVYPDAMQPCWCGSKRRYYKCCQPFDIP